MPQTNDVDGPLHEDDPFATAGHYPPRLPTDRPTSARTCAMALGSKDNFAIDRSFVQQSLNAFPEFLDLARESRMFLYRTVRYLARDLGIRQFLDLGSGLPIDGNVHQVAQSFAPDARVVYVDSDPIVVVHGQSELSDFTTTAFARADITEPDTVLASPEVQGLIDFDQPLAVLLLSIPHLLEDDDVAQRTIHEPMRHAAPGSVLALTHIVAEDAATAAATSELINGLGLTWRTRTRDTVANWLCEYDPIDPGLVDINRWRPDETQPPVAEAHPLVRQYIGVPVGDRRVHECGGLFRKTE